MNAYKEHSQVRVARSCYRKQRYKTKAEADEKRASFGLEFGSSYKCENCGSWHITKMRQNRG